mgnify:CR=1 FL=1|jgi:hypothetical protein
MTSSGPVITKRSADRALTDQKLTEQELIGPEQAEPELTGLYCLAI